ncbi:MAG: glucose-6-phosphate isomerase [Gammaproteobacteria bacterium]|nr:glucose-6-phosphate isomerase [Gammaproteobacteria bacterium]
MSDRPDARESWKRLGVLATETVRTHLRDLGNDPARFASMSLRVGPLLIDFSRQRANADVVSALVALAQESRLEAAVEGLFDGGEANRTEGRSALHTAVRAPLDERPQRVATEIETARGRMLDIAERVRRGRWLGVSGLPIRHVVHIGIGGSHLGPELAVHALAGPPASSRIDVRFLANVDGRAAVDTFRGLDPERTLVIVASKSFDTLETLANARHARSWFIERTGRADAMDRHFVAVTGNAGAASELGIPPGNHLPMWDWVGGRFSLWSSVGLSVAIAIGAARFAELLAGAHAMDRHFRGTRIERNAAALFGLFGIWNSNFLGAGTHAVLPYDRRLAGLPGYLQQLEMESNGKSVRIDGERSQTHTAPVVWGGEETNGQHAFHQLLHQGTRSFSADLVAVAAPGHDLAERHRWLLANCLGQGSALLRGRDAPAHGPRALAPHRAVPGNRATTTVLLDALTPASLGALLALYEHKVFTQATVWGINPFDQWGVELGKQLAHDVFGALGGGPARGLDAATAGLVAEVRKSTS